MFNVFMGHRLHAFGLFMEISRIGRIFLALKLGPGALESLRFLQGHDIVNKAAQNRIIPICNWHITLVFLGNVSGPQYDQLLTALRTSELGSGFEITLQGFGFFPNPKRPRVFWLGVGPGSERVVKLQSSVASICQTASFPKEGRPFHPHLTLARLKSPRDSSGLLEELPEVKVKVRVDEVVLYRSTLTDTGSIYEVLETFPLTDA